MKPLKVLSRSAKLSSPEVRNRTSFWQAAVIAPFPGGGPARRHLSCAAPPPEFGKVPGEEIQTIGQRKSSGRGSYRGSCISPWPGPEAKGLRTVIALRFAYANWQRGSNENTNGLPRQYVSSGPDLSVRWQVREISQRAESIPKKKGRLPATFQIQRCEQIKRQPELTHPACGDTP